MYPIREATLGDLNAIEALIEASVWGLATGDYSDAQIRGALAGAWGVDLADGLTIQFVPMTRTLATKSEKGK